MSFEIEASRNSPIDLYLPETFHRLKRTVLLLSASLILLCLVSPSVTTAQQIHLTVVDINLSAAVLRWLIWAGCFYYAAGFGLEVVSARRLNSVAMRRGKPGGLDGALSILQQEITKGGAQAAEINEATKDFNAFVESKRVELLAKDNFKALDKDADLKLLGLSVPNPSLSSMVYTAPTDEHEQRWRSNEVANHLLTGVQALKDSRAVLDNLVQRQEAFSQEILAVLRRAHRDMTALSPRLQTERRLMFWGWEVGGAVAILLAASILHLTLQFVPGTASLVTSIVGTASARADETASAPRSGA